MEQLTFLMLPLVILKPNINKQNQSWFKYDFGNLKSKLKFKLKSQDLGEANSLLLFAFQGEMIVSKFHFLQQKGFRQDLLSENLK